MADENHIDTDEGKVNIKTRLVEPQIIVKIPPILSTIHPPPPAYNTESDDVSLNSESSLNCCRICFSGNDDPDNILISPCRCSGSVGFIHRKCLTKWLQERKGSKSTRCELCNFTFNRHKKINIKKCEFPSVTNQDKVFHVIFIINLIVMISCAIATILCFLADRGRIKDNDKADETLHLTVEEIITLTCGVLFFVSFFIAMAVQIKAKTPIYQLCMKFIMQNVEWTIDEYDKSRDRRYLMTNAGPQFV